MWEVPSVPIGLVFSTFLETSWKLIQLSDQIIAFECLMVELDCSFSLQLVSQINSYLSWVLPLWHYNFIISIHHTFFMYFVGCWLDHFLMWIDWIMLISFLASAQRNGSYPLENGPVVTGFIFFRLYQCIRQRLWCVSLSCHRYWWTTCLWRQIKSFATPLFCW